MPPTDAQTKTIITLWNEGRSYGQIAKAVGGRKSTVQGWISSLIKAQKIAPRTDGVRTATKRATEARLQYDLERRLALNNLWLEKIEKILLSTDDPRAMRDLAVPYGIVEDKRRLLEPTSQDSRRPAAIDAYIEGLKNEAAKDGPEAKGQHPKQQ